MIATCPVCATRYNIPGQVIGDAGRTVRCTTCGHKWQQMLLHDDDATAVGDIPLSAREMPLSAPIDSRRTSAVPQHFKYHTSPAVKAVSLGIIIFIVGAVCIGMGLAKGRLIASWPATARLYALFDSPIKVLGEGLALQNVEAQSHAEDGAVSLNVQGTIQNTSKQTRAVPSIKVSLIGDTGSLNASPMKDWVFPATAGTLAAGASESFNKTFSTTPAGASNILLTFSSENNEARK